MLTYLKSLNAGHFVSVSILIFAAVYLVWPDLALKERTQGIVFDQFQRGFPRQVSELPAMIVDIDDRAIQDYGPWPWPRARIAELVDRIHTANALAIGLDFIMAEADHAEIRKLSNQTPELRRLLAPYLGEQSQGDKRLAETLQRAPVVLGNAGIHSLDRSEAETAGPNVDLRTPYLVEGPTGTETALIFQNIMTNLPLLEEASQGRGLLNADPDSDGVIRTVPLVGKYGAGYAPAFTLELLRVAIGGRWITLIRDEQGITGIKIAETTIPTDRDGHLRPYFSPTDERRFISASEVLSGQFEPSLFENKIVMVGVSALGLFDVKPVPVTAAMLGTEVHAQVIENIFLNSRLIRLPAADYIETAIFIVAGLAVIIFVSLSAPLTGGLFFIFLLLGMAGTAVLAFWQFQLLFEPVAPSLFLALLFISSLAGSLVTANRRRRNLANTLQRERIVTARLQGELDAARKIQESLLPDPQQDDASENLTIAALLQPARQVGGDLYHYFPLGKERFFFMVGDVSDKGVPAALFMAVCATVVKAEARQEAANLEPIVNNTNRLLAADNAANMFVTAVMMAVNHVTGELEWCNAGHPSPLVLHPDGSVVPLLDDGGPPLAMLPQFPYPTATGRLAEGDVVIIVTDGVTEAENAEKELFGTAGLLACISDYAARQPATAETGRMNVTPSALARHIDKSVAAFRGDAEPNDDLAMVIFRWS